MRIAVKAEEKKYDMEKEEAAYKRRYEYFYGLLTDRDSVEERTLFQYHPFVEKRMLKFYERFRKKVSLHLYKEMQMWKAGVLLLHCSPFLSRLCS